MSLLTPSSTLSLACWLSHLFTFWHINIESTLCLGGSVPHMISDSLHEVATCMMKKHGARTGSNACSILHRVRTMQTCILQQHHSFFVCPVLNFLNSFPCAGVCIISAKKMWCVSKVFMSNSSLWYLSWKCNKTAKGMTHKTCKTCLNFYTNKTLEHVCALRKFVRNYLFSVVIKFCFVFFKFHLTN